MMNIALKLDLKMTLPLRTRRDDLHIPSDLKYVKLLMTSSSEKSLSLAIPLIALGSFL